MTLSYAILWPAKQQRHIDVAEAREIFPLSLLSLTSFIHPLVIKQVPLPASLRQSNKSLLWPTKNQTYTGFDFPSC